MDKLFFKILFPLKFSFFIKYLPGSSVCSTSNLLGTVGISLESVRLKVPVAFFSRPLSFPVTQSYLISCMVTGEDDPGVLMLIRAMGRQLASLKDPERQEKTTEHCDRKPASMDMKGTKCEI